MSRADEIQEADIGTKCGLFEVRKLGDEYFAFFEECKDPGACSILLRGGSKDVLNEIERNLQDAMQVARNVVFEPLLLPGGGATEMRLAHELKKRADEIEGVEQFPFRAVGEALEVIPRTLLQNCGADVVRVMTSLRAKQAETEESYGVDGVTGKVTPSEELGVWEPFRSRRSPSRQPWRLRACCCASTTLCLAWPRRRTRCQVISYRNEREPHGY